MYFILQTAISFIIVRLDKVNKNYIFINTLLIHLNPELYGTYYYV